MERSEENPEHVARKPKWMSSNAWKLPVAMAIGLVFASLPIMEFMDRYDYIRYLRITDHIFSQYGSWVQVLSNEPLWLALTYSLGAVMPPEWGLRLIIFASSTTTFFVLLKLSPERWVLPFLLATPFMATNYVVHLRQGTALAIFMAGMLVGGKAKFAIWVLTPFVHSGFALVIAALLTWEALRTRFSSIRSAALAQTGIMALLGIAIPLAANLVGARQASLYQSGASGSGAGFVIWGTVLVLTIALWRSQKADPAREWGIAMLCFYVASYWTFPAVGRVFEGTFPLVILTLSAIGTAERFRDIPAIIAIGFGAAVYLSRLSEPWIGFGVQHSS